MKLVTGVSYNDFVTEIKNSDKQIICYGAGLVALATEHIFENSGIVHRVQCFVDKDPLKRGVCLKYGDRSVSIIGIDDLTKMDLSNKVLLLTLEVFGAVIESLEKYVELDCFPCYIFAELNQSYLKNLQTVHPLVTVNSKIPKVIHYAWLGGGEMTSDMLRCIDTWKKLCPDYELVCWNENNYDVYKNQYMRQSYEAKKYAFTVDFLKLDVLYQHGGIYLDTDVELLRNLDGIISNKAFAVYLEWAVPTFGICGSISGLQIFKELRDNPRSVLPFINADGNFNQKISSYYEVDVLERYGFRKDFTLQTIQDLTIYPPQFFSTNGRLGLNAPINDSTYAVHYCHRSWADSNRMDEINKTSEFANNLKNGGN